MLPLWAHDALHLLAWSSTKIVTPHLLTRLDSNDTSTVDLLRAKKIDSLWYHARAHDSAVQRLYDKVWTIQRNALLDILNRLSRVNVLPVIFKGAEALEASHGSRAISLLNDIDLLVPRQAVAKVKQVFYSAGYTQGAFDSVARTFVDRDVADVARLESTHYELAPFNRIEQLALDDEERLIAEKLSVAHPLRKIDDVPTLLVEFDVHHGIATDVGCDDLFVRAVDSSFDHARTLSPADHVWLTTARLYNEVAIHSKDSLRDFAYILPLIARAPVDWNVVVHVARELDLRPSLYYYLRFMDALAGGPIPPAFIATLDPRTGIRIRDWGWQLGKLFGFVDPWPFVMTPEFQAPSRYVQQAADA